MLIFRHVAGGFKGDVESHFLHAYSCAPQQWENTLGAKKIKSWLFWNRSVDMWEVSPLVVIPSQMEKGKCSFSITCVLLHWFPHLYVLLNLMHFTPTGFLTSRVARVPR